jgi:hypothetical protein
VIHPHKSRGGKLPASAGAKKGLLVAFTISVNPKTGRSEARDITAIDDGPATATATSVLAQCVECDAIGRHRYGCSLA